MNGIFNLNTPAAADTRVDGAWNTADLQNSNALPPEVEAESRAHYGDINVRPFFAKLAMEQERISNGQIHAKNEEMKELRDKLQLITRFLDRANHAMSTTTSDTIQMTDDADLLVEMKKILPEHIRNIIGDRSTFTRQEMKWLCEVLTRNIDSDIIPQIDEVKDQIFDIMQLLDKILPILKKLLEQYDAHINYILRQPR